MVAKDTNSTEEAPQTFNKAWNHPDPKSWRKWQETMWIQWQEQATEMNEDMQESYDPKFQVHEVHLGVWN